MKTLDDYLDINALVLRYPQFTKNQIRWLIANKEDYGIEKIIKRIGRKIYFDVPAFAAWIHKQEA